MPKVGIVISNYNGWQDTLVCLDSLQKQTFTDFEVILIDDASPNDSVAQLQNKLPPNTVFLPQERNVGFAAANNIGMRRALDDGCDFALLLNNDTSVRPDFLEKLLAETPAGAVSCPKMLFMDPPDEIWFAGGELDPKTGKVKHLGGHKKDGPEFAEKKQVSFITFCCVLLPRAVIEKVGYLDETLFMYCEDVDYCIRLAQAGVPMWFLPDAVIHHKAGGSAGGMLSVYYITRNTLYLTCKGKSAAYAKLKTILPLLTGAARYALTKQLAASPRRGEVTPPYIHPEGGIRPLAPSARGLRPQAVGERTLHSPEIFGQRSTSLPPALRGHLPRRGRQEERRHLTMDLSILLVQYRPDEGELRRTLASLLRQSCRDFELVVADDGSDEDFFPLTRKILAENGFTGAKFVKLTPNGGTVKNVLNGAKQAAGKWVFTVSPGDYLYDADTVAWLLEVLRRDAPRVAFGRLACYADRNGAPIRRPGDAPFDRTPYRPGAYDARTAKRNMLLYDDGISGAGLVYERELLVQALEKMAGRVLLAEDFAARLFAVENIPIVGYDRCIAWYEVGTGVSTNEGARARMLRDWRAMVELLRELYPKDRTVRLAYEYYFNDRHKSRLVRGLVGRLIVPQNAPFKKAQHAWVPPVNGDIQELKQIYESALGPSPARGGKE